MRITERKESPIIGLTGMGGGLTSYILYGSSGSSVYEISRSLRFNSTDSAYLSRTPASAGNRKTWTWAGWVKRTAFGTEGGIFSTYAGAHPNTSLFWESDGLKFHDYTSDYQFRLGTAAVFRDPSAWYHIVLAYDSTQGTVSDRAKLWINGTLQTLSGTTVPLNHDTDWNSVTQHDIGRFAAYLDGYLADIHFIDGVSGLSATDFGEFDEYGIWNPKLYTGNYGTNGWHLKFDDNSNASALGTDSTDNSNNWTTNNISVAAGAGNDSFIDSPTNLSPDSGNSVGNYATLNPLKGALTLTNGNLDSTSPSGWKGSAGTIGMSSGKWYWEIDNVVGNEHVVGIVKTDVDNITWNTTYGYGAETGAKYLATSGVAYGAAWTTGDVIGVAFDADNGTLTFYKNGVSQGVAATGLTDGPYLPSVVHNGSSRSSSINFGQRAWTHTPPTDHLALCTQNLPTPTILKGSEYMEVVTYTGSSSGGTFDVPDFSPDFIWSKNTDSAPTNHVLADSVRGYGDNKSLFSNLNNAEAGTGNIMSVSGNTVTYGTNSNFTGGVVSFAWDAGSNSNKTYTITVADPGSGNKFYADGSLTPTLTLAEGATYIFDQSDSSNSTHPLRFSTASDGTHAGGTEYTTGVTVVGTPGSAGAYTQIVIASPAPTLYAYCSSHSGMGFQINTSDTAGYTIPAGAHNDVYYDTSKSWTSLVTTTSLSSDYNSYSPTSKLGCFDGKRSTSLYGSNGAALVVTFDSTAFPVANGPYTVEVENNQRAITLNDGLADAQTGSSWPGQATGWQKFDPVSTIATITSAAASGAYGGMINRIRVNGKVLVDPSATPDDVPSISTRVLASSESGFSISKWEGTGANATIAHGCNTTPSIYFVKSLDNAEDWQILTPLIGTNAMDIGSFNLSANFSISYDETPTNLIIGRRGSVDADGENMIAYCFSPRDGYSAIGTYTGNNLDSGPMIYTGFRPKWLLVKVTDQSDHWTMWDSTRGEINVNDLPLYPNLTNAQSSTPGRSVDFLSNGFKLRGSDGSINGGSADGTTFYNYVYIAFAENPLSIARAR